MIVGTSSKFEKRIIIDGRVYEYIVKQMTDEEIKRYYDHVNKSGVKSLFLFSLKNNSYTYTFFVNIMTSFIHIFWINMTNQVMKKSSISFTTITVVSI